MDSISLSANWMWPCRAQEGDLYCLALSHLRLWAFVTPVGGVSFLAGWVLMLIGAIRLKRKGVVHE